jgi:hypothetical protein
VPVNLWLPVFVDDDVEPRSGTAVVERMLCLTLIAARAEGLERPRTIEVLTEFGLLPAITPNEKQFLDQEAPTEHQRAQFVWKYECAWALQWALGIVPVLGDCRSICQADQVSRNALAVGKNFQATPVGKEQILDAGDMLYRMHWACRDAQLNGKPVVVGLEPGVVWERRRAIQWLLEPDVDWDDLSLDT